MTPKLDLLGRQLNRSESVNRQESDKAASKALLSRQDIADNTAKEAKEATKVLMDKLAKSEAEIARLNKELIEAGKDATQKQNVLLHKINDTKDAAKQEMEVVCDKHYGQMSQLAGQVENLQTQLSMECQSKVKAEAERDSANRMCANLERMVAKLQDVKPVALAPAPVIKEQKLVVFRITKRDENGRAVEFSQMQ